MEWLKYLSWILGQVHPARRPELIIWFWDPVDYGLVNRYLLQKKVNPVSGTFMLMVAGAEGVV